MFRQFLAIALLSSVSLACGARSGLRVPEEDASAQVDGGLDAGVDAAVDAGVDAGFDAGVDGGTLPFDGSVVVDPYEACDDSLRLETRSATVPIDVVFALDSSGSMVDELQWLEQNIEIFWDYVRDTSVDIHVIFVAEEGYAPGPPAGFYNIFRHIRREVASWDALYQLLARFSEYSSFLRPDAETHFVIVTDDDSRTLSATDFIPQMTELLGHDFTAHAVASPFVPEHVGPWNPTGACGTTSNRAWRPGFEYVTLTDETGGLFLSICNDDWSELWQLLTDEIVVPIPLPCAVRTPIPPIGTTIDPEVFTVLWSNPEIELLVTLPRVDPPGDEGCVDGWWYNEPSDRVELCTATCDAVQTYGGSIELDVGICEE